MKLRGSPRGCRAAVGRGVGSGEGATEREQGALMNKISHKGWAVNDLRKERESATSQEERKKEGDKEEAGKWGRGKRK